MQATDKKAISELQIDQGKGPNPREELSQLSDRQEVPHQYDEASTDFKTISWCRTNIGTLNTLKLLALPEPIAELENKILSLDTQDLFIKTCHPVQIRQSIHRC